MTSMTLCLVFTSDFVDTVFGLYEYLNDNVFGLYLK